MNKDVFRASYSVLERWSTGDYKGAIKTYFKLSDYVSVEMEDGKDLHDKFAKETEKTKCLPTIFGGKPLIEILGIEEKKEFKITDWLEIVGVKDLFSVENVFGNNITVIRDYKTGGRVSSDYINKPQLGIYGYMALLQEKPAQMGVITHYNQYTKEIDNSYIWLTKEKVQKDLTWLIQNSKEMFKYMHENDVFNRVEEILQKGDNE